MPQYLSVPSGDTKPSVRELRTRSAKPVPSGPVEIGIVFDRSSSIQHLRKAAVASFNLLLDEQKKLAVPTRFSLFFFNDEISVVHDGSPIGEVPKMEPADYSPQGNTALLDGIGSMIETVASRTDPSPYPSRVLIAILTDGQGNSSVRFTKGEIFELISFRRSACDWQFLFMGVGGQTVPCGLSLGIQRSNIVEFEADPEGVRRVMLALSNTVRAYQLGTRNFALLLRGR
jgi:hypothetical protein